MGYLVRKRKKMAAGLGFEPRYADPESAVLPLDDPAILRQDFDDELSRIAQYKMQEDFNKLAIFLQFLWEFSEWNTKGKITPFSNLAFGENFPTHFFN